MAPARDRRGKKNFASSFTAKHTRNATGSRATPPTGPRAGLGLAMAQLFDARQPLFPDAVQLHGRTHIAQAILGDLSIASFFEHAVHVQTGHALALRRFNAERLAIEIEVEPARGSFAPAHAVEGQLFGQITMRLEREAIAQPVLAR